MLAALEQESTSIPRAEQQRAVATLQHTIEKIDHTLNQIEASIPVADKATDQRTPVHKPVIARLNKAVAEVERRVQDAGEVVSEAQEAERGETEARRA
jgi:hypothetical protein